MVCLYQLLVPVPLAKGMRADLIVLFNVGEITRELHFRGTLHWTRRWPLKR